MDPTETIIRLRELLGGDHSGYAPNRKGTAIVHDCEDYPCCHKTKDRRDLDDLHEMLCQSEELFQALDGWLRSGGSVPVQWSACSIPLRGGSK